MKKSLFLIILMTTSCALLAQDRNYHYFSWKGHYGIVDTYGNEIIEPSYTKIKHKELMSCDILSGPGSRAAAINTQNGHHSRFDYLNPNTIMVNYQPYMLAIRDSQAFLVDYEHIRDEIMLPANYTEVNAYGDYLVGLLPRGANRYRIDLMSMEKPDSVLRFFEGIANLYPCKDKISYSTRYILPKKDEAHIFDHNFNLLRKVPERLDDPSKIEEYIRKSEELVFGSGDKFPPTRAKERSNRCIVPSDELLDEGYMLIKIKTTSPEKNSLTPFFKFRFDPSKMHLFPPEDSLLNTVQVGKNDESDSVVYFLFLTDPEHRKVFFPKKYWAKIGLQIIEQNDVKIEYKKTANKFYAEDTYPEVNKNKFVPYKVDRADGIYQLVPKETQILQKQNTLADEPFLLPSDIQEVRVYEKFGQRRLHLKFKAELSEKIRKMTKENLGNYLAIVVDGTVIVMAFIDSEILNAGMIITGENSDEGFSKIKERWRPDEASIKKPKRFLKSRRSN